MRPDSFLELQEISNILQNFANATSLAVVLVDIEGCQVFSSFNFTNFCSKVCQNPSLHERCKNSGHCAGLKASRENKLHVYRCYAGLMNFSMPLEIDDHLVGFVLCGQARIKNASNLEDCQPADKEWMKNSDVVEDYEQIPIIDYSKLFSAANLLKRLVNIYLKKSTDFVTINDTHHSKQLIPSHDSSHSYDIKIKKVVRYIEAHYFEDITLVDAADHVFLSPHYLSKLFKKEIGIGFNQYINQQRLQGAKKMLQYSDWSIARIAHNLGYSCSSYFCKVFRNTYGITPQYFRNSILEEQQTLR
ncbi:PocR ligand-binding domain-containing protein [Vibrio sp. MA40-2]|uniref:PocR ligand-binding domain-containing protein n=1 Tax=Vibrio sp. MA40-2 TaxID=3391828 RepID=UPI0039A42766